MHLAKLVGMVGVCLVATTSVAHAQQRYYDGDRYDRGSYDRSYGGDRDEETQDVCSGQRAHALEADLSERVRDGAISRYEASKLHQQIDTYEYYGRIACSRGDRRSIQGFSDRYSWLERKMDQATRDRNGDGY